MGYNQINKIALVGALGFGEATSSGQIIRTNIIKNALCNEYGMDAVLIVNTSMISKKPWLFITSFIRMLFSCNDIMIVFSINGMKRLWPVFSLISKLFGKRIYNNVIGGNIISHLDKYPNILYFWFATFCISILQHTVRHRPTLQIFSVHISLMLKRLC